jgi:hypothetical protein
MEVTAAVIIVPHDVASRVDPIRLRQNRSRYIDGGKFTLAQQKTMSVAAAVIIVPDDVASRVDIERLRLSGSRYIDGRKTYRCSTENHEGSRCCHDTPPR